MCARPIYTPLRRRQDFHRIHSQGRRQGDALLQVRVLPYLTDAPVQITLRLGIVVSKKYGTAVERNRFKRLVRAAIRALAPEMRPGWDILVLPRAAKNTKMPEILQSLRELFTALDVIPFLPAGKEEEST